MLVSRVIARETILTGRAGFDMAFKNKKDSLPVPDHPLLYIPSYNLSKRLSWFAGVRIDGNMVKNFNYMADVRFVSSGLGIKDWELIHRGYFIWNKSIRFAALIGYRLSYGHYGNTNQFFILPVADLIWKINVKPQPVKDLFR